MTKIRVFIEDHTQMSDILEVYPESAHTEMRDTILYSLEERGFDQTPIIRRNVVPYIRLASVYTGVYALVMSEIFENDRDAEYDPERTGQLTRAILEDQCPFLAKGWNNREAVCQAMVRAYRREHPEAFM